MKKILPLFSVIIYPKKVLIVQFCCSQVEYEVDENNYPSRWNFMRIHHENDFKAAEQGGLCDKFTIRNDKNLIREDCGKIQWPNYHFSHRWKLRRILLVPYMFKYVVRVELPPTLCSKVWNRNKDNCSAYSFTSNCFSLSESVGRLYDNYEGLLDQFAAFWGEVARTFAGSRTISNR